MLRALSLAISSLMIAQNPDDMILCTTASDCPAGASCEDGVCVLTALDGGEARLAALGVPFARIEPA